MPLPCPATVYVCATLVPHNRSYESGCIAIVIVIYTITAIHKAQASLCERKVK